MTSIKIDKAPENNTNYIFNREALYHPEFFPAFPDKASLPATFNNNDTRLSFVNAWWLSKASHLAYCAKDQIKKQLNQIGLELYGFYSRQGSQAFIATGKDYAWLSFRGTTPTEKSNLKNDLAIRQVKLSSRISVHQGFLRSLDVIWPDIEMVLQHLSRQHYKFWFTGHSLGAAMATLAATRIAPAALYTFGSPRVGNQAFGQLLHAVDVHRFVNCCDAVPLLPPTRLGYQHVGQELFLSADHQLLVAPEGRQRFSLRLQGNLRFYRPFPWFISNALWLRSLADHIILNYSNALLIQLEESA